MHRVVVPESNFTGLSLNYLSERRSAFRAGLILFSASISAAAIMVSCRHSDPSNPPPVVTSTSKAAPGGIRFDVVTEQAGIHFQYPQQPKPMRSLEAFGRGCAFFDYDGDGFQDILLVASPTVAFYHNLGNGKFEETTAATGL